MSGDNECFDATTGFNRHRLMVATLACIPIDALTLSRCGGSHTLVKALDRVASSRVVRSRCSFCHFARLIREELGGSWHSALRTKTLGRRRKEPCYCLQRSR